MIGRPARIREWFRFDGAFVRRLALQVASYGALALLGLAVEEYVNPFGVVEAIKDHSAIIVQQVAAPLRDIDWHQEIGLSGSPEREAKLQSGQRAVTVILIDQDFLDLLNEKGDAARTVLAKCAGPAGSTPPNSTPGANRVAAIAVRTDPEPGDVQWPLPVRVLVQCVLGPIARQQPKAIFIDLAFPDVARQIEPGGVYSRRASAEALGSALIGRWAAADPETDRALRKVPLLIGADIEPAVAEVIPHGPECVDQDDLAGASLNSPYLRTAAFGQQPPTLAGQWPRLEVVSAGWHGRTDIYPLIPQIMAPHGSCKTAFSSDEGFLVSPAMRLYQIGTEESDELAAALRPSAGFWGTSGFRRYSIVDRHWKRHYPASVLVPMWGAHLSATSRAAYGGAEGADTCMDHQHRSLTMALRAYVSNIIGRAEPGEINPCPYIDTINASAIFDQDFARLFLKNRLVLLGVDLPVTADRFTSPINQNLPGVYAHAAALENLLRYRDGFHNEAPGPRAWLTVIALFLLAPPVTKRIAHLILHKMRHLPNLQAGALIWLVALASLLFALMTILTFAAVLVLMGSDLPAKDIAIPLIVVHAPVWHAIVEETKAYAADVVRQIRDLLYSWRRPHSADASDGTGHDDHIWPVVDEAIAQEQAIAAAEPAARPHSPLPGARG